MTSLPKTGIGDLDETIKKFKEELETTFSGKTEELHERVIELERARMAIFNLLEDSERSREELIETKARNSAILASIGEGIVVTDTETKIIYVNPAFEQMLGWSKAEVINKLLHEVAFIVDKSGNTISEPDTLIRRSIDQRVIIVDDIRYGYKKKDGTTFPVSVTTSPILADSMLFGAVEVFHDITKEKELDRMKSEFISIASHQLRTPLTGIQWVVERFTKKEQLSPKGKEYLEDIHMSTKRLTKMVDLLLNLSRIEAGRVSIVPEPLELVSFLESFLTEMEPLRDKKELNIYFNEHPAELSIVTDKSALQNIMQSLISNAIEYTLPGGRIDITVQIKKDTFLIKIKDTGIGIPRAEQSHIFEKFVRVSNGKLHKSNGTGIGLFIVAQNVVLLGGKVWFESEENKGSTFFVELPLVLESQKT